MFVQAPALTLKKVTSHNYLSGDPFGALWDTYSMQPRPRPKQKKHHTFKAPLVHAYIHWKPPCGPGTHQRCTLWTECRSLNHRWPPFNQKKSFFCVQTPPTRPAQPKINCACLLHRSEILNKVPSVCFSGEGIRHSYMELPYLLIVRILAVQFFCKSGSCKLESDFTEN